MMRLERISWRIVRGRLADGVEQARRQWRERAGLWLRLTDADGQIGDGEASPLPDFSPDTLEDVIAAVERWDAGRVNVDETAPLRPQVQAVIDVLPAEVPALRFAVETALLDLLGKRLAQPYPHLLSDEPDPTPIPVAALVTTLDRRLARSQARAALDRGLRHLKVKIGRRGRSGGWQQELALLGDLRDAFGNEIVLRLDANGMLPPEQLDERLDALASLAPELLEEPVASAVLVVLAEEGKLRSPVPLALDETLQVPGAFERLEPWLRAGGCRALVLKPMALGGALRCLELAERARGLGVASFVTHLFDGPIGRAAAAGLALALPGERLACGLDEHAGLAIWPVVGSGVVAGRVVGSERPGLGVESDLSDRSDLSDLSDLSDGDSRLSLLGAAFEVPDRLAWVTPQGSFSYGGLGPRVEAAVAWLAELGLTAAGSPEPRVCLLGEASFATLVVFQALVELGVPCAMVHPRLAPEERAGWIAECRPSLALDAERLAEAAAWIEEDLAAKAARGRRVLASWPAPGSERCLAIVRTSGSTGHPKGVVLSRRAFVASARASARRLGWRDGDRWLLSLPLAHVGGLSILTRSTVARRTVVVPAWTSFRGEEVLRTVVVDRVTLLSLVPTMLRRLLALAEPPATLRAVLIGGAAASPALLGEAADRDWPVLATYGLTEACSQVTLQPVGTIQRGEMGSGPPLDGVEVRIRDGVIEVRGPILMSGYEPPDGASPWTVDGWLRTADLGFLDEDGNLHVRGRRDDVVISGGENVAPLAVEQVLEAHPAIAEAAVFGIPHPEWGHAVAAAVVLREGAVLDSGELGDFLRARLAGFARPRYVARLAALERGVSGKVDRARTAEAALDRLEPC